jgi:hypothetical protein
MAAGKRSGKRPAEQGDPEEALLHVLAHPLRKQLLRLYVEEKGMLSPKELADFHQEAPLERRLPRPRSCRTGSGGDRR